MKRESFRVGDVVEIPFTCTHCGLVAQRIRGRTVRATVNNTGFSGTAIIVIRLDSQPCEHRGIEQRALAEHVTLVSAVDLLAGLV